MTAVYTGTKPELIEILSAVTHFETCMMDFNYIDIS